MNSLTDAQMDTFSAIAEGRESAMVNGGPRPDLPYKFDEGYFVPEGIWLATCDRLRAVAKYEMMFSESVKHALVVEGYLRGKREAENSSLRSENERLRAELAQGAAEIEDLRGVNASLFAGEANDLRAENVVLRAELEQLHRRHGIDEITRVALDQFNPACKAGEEGGKA